MIDFIVWIVFGAFVGGVAQFLVPGQQNLGWIKSILLGVGGSFVGGWLLSLVGWSEGTGFHPTGLIGSTIGAVVLLVAYVKFVVKK